MSKIGSYVYTLQEIVDNMVYNGATTEKIVQVVESELPGTPRSFVDEAIVSAVREMGFYDC